MRVCKHCGEEKPLEKFVKQKKCRQGRGYTCGQCRWARQKTYPSNTPDRRKDVRLKYLYGISLEEYRQMLFLQENKCAICKKAPNGQGADAVLHVDHCHDSGRVRGLLCGDCNKALGLLGDDQRRMSVAIDYLQLYS